MVGTISKRLEYVQLKLAILREYLKEKEYKAVLLRRLDNISWLTCGDLNELPYNLEKEKFGLLITEDQLFLIANNPELSRNIVDEIAGLQITVVQYPYCGNIEKEINGIIGSEKVSSDTDFSIYQTETQQLEELRFSILR
ncbi:hypothetical protein [Metabacillus sp. FJAT-53654]|uniref:Uncharacterized protein n=1 Tax=Metabacillus rhizosphaerae TaxID=3117747 RepID=A0ABZ2MTG4_9BACI